MSDFNGYSPSPFDGIEKAILGSDLSLLSAKERLDYYNRVCSSLGLNPFTKPFSYILLDDGKGGKKLTFYATKDCTEQLRKINNISIFITDRQFSDDLYIVTARATDNNGRSDESTGSVSFTMRKKENKDSKKYIYYQASGEMKANLLMKAETKAKRRVTLSVCGLGILDESKTDYIPGSIVVPELLISKSKPELLHELNLLIEKHSIPSETIDKWLDWGSAFDLQHLEEDKLLKIINGVQKRYELNEVKWCSKTL